MTVQERKERNLKRRKKQAAKRNMILLLATVFMITIGSVIFGSSFSSAKNDVELCKYYKSIEINRGDSLWSIAEEHKPEGESTIEYINELKELNNLTSDTIHECRHLIVSYYDVMR